MIAVAQPEAPAVAPTYLGSWLGVTRARFADLTGLARGYLIALEVKGWGVLVLGSADPAYYLLTLEKRMRPQFLAAGDGLDLVAVWGPMDGYHQAARELVEAFVGTKQASLVKADFAEVNCAVRAKLSAWGVPS
jgi:hypothetical protein